MFQEYRHSRIRHVERHRTKTVILSSDATRANIKGVGLAARHRSKYHQAVALALPPGKIQRKESAEPRDCTSQFTHTHSLEGRPKYLDDLRPAKSGHGGTPKTFSLSPFIFFLHLSLVLVLQKVITFLSLSLSLALWGKQLARLEALDFQVKLCSVAKDFDIEKSVDMFRLWSTSHQQENDPLNHDAKINELKAAIGPLSGRSLQFCTDACFRRYVEARNWNLDKAKKMLEETLKWRSTYKPEEIRWREVACEGETGKVYRASFRDRSGRTVLILRPGMQIVKYFLDNKTFHKVKFVYPKNKDSVELMKQYFDEENLPIEFGGPAILNYDHEEFSKLMNQDDVKSAAFWCPDDKPPHWANGRSGAEVAPEPVSLTPAAS